MKPVDTSGMSRYANVYTENKVAQLIRLPNFPTGCFGPFLHFPL